QGTAGVLEAIPPEPVPISRQESGQAVRQYVDPESNQTVVSTGRDPEESSPARVATQLRDRPAGSGGRLTDDQPASRPRQLRDDDGLSALSPRESRFD